MINSNRQPDFQRFINESDPPVLYAEGTRVTFRPEPLVGTSNYPCLRILNYLLSTLYYAKTAHAVSR